MLLIASLIGIYSYLIFILGLVGLLYKNLIIWFISTNLLIIIYINRKKIIGEIRNLKGSKKLLKENLLLLLSLIFFIQAVINLIGAMGPELAFDALWYHLTLPKLYLEQHTIFYIPGGLLYYSAMPKLGEMLYIVGLTFGNEILAKVIHFLFGILTSVALYKSQRRFFTPLISKIGDLIFYSNLVVAWESATAYVDLIRSFFEIMSLWAFINWWEDGKRKWFILSAIMVGLAITTKLLAVGSLLIFSVIIIIKQLKKWPLKPKLHNILYMLLNTFTKVSVYLLIALTMPLPWFIFAFINTGNPVYPFFSQIYSIAPEPLIIPGFFKEIWILFTSSPDPLSPLYIIFLPIIIFSFSKLRTEIKIISLYSVLAIVVWYFTPRTGGGRFILPYLPAFSIICAACLNFLIENKKKYGELLPKFLIILVIFVSLISIGYRFAANSKYIPVLLGQETKQEFLTTHLNFAFGDFYDTDNFFKDNIKETDRVLLYGFHNLYYINFPFIDSSWLKAWDTFNYIATQNTQLPEKYKNWKLVYTNNKTMVNLYKSP